MELKLDTYNFRARLAPLLIVILPTVLAVAVWLPLESESWKLLGSLGMSAALSLLLVQLGRDGGKQKQTRLFEAWGGKPTTRLLRHRDQGIDAHTKSRYHQKLRALLPDVPMPSASREEEAPEESDAAYESCGKYLLEATRDKKRFPLVFDANVSYGFRRNLWGMKPTGIANSLVGLISAVGNALYAYTGTSNITVTAVTAIAICGLLLTWWLLRIKPFWVKLAADAFAERLLAACETLSPPEGRRGTSVIVP